MSKEPLVSVITPAYNAARFIGETIQSVIDQTYNNWEMLIVDDKSTDETVEIVQQYMNKDKRIKLIVLDENSGSAIARNTAMDKASGKFMAFLDSDDLWMPEKLTKQVAFMEDNGIAFSFTKYVRMQEDGRLTNAVTEAPKTVTYDRLMKQCVIGCLTVMLDRERIGNERMINIRTRQDYAFWLALLRKGHLAYGMDEVLAKYRLVENSISSDKVKAAKQNWKLYHDIEDHSFIKAAWYFAHYAWISVTNVIKFRLKK
ncbi:MAG TPA: glycosyltransferase family 2 protein [Pseudogracilibacillus sp.]|nr:glycosyltransferase family 2 protein [Pseudogracilibacillus sp.]